MHNHPLVKSGSGKKPPESLLLAIQPSQQQRGQSSNPQSARQRNLQSLLPATRSRPLLEAHMLSTLPRGESRGLWSTQVPRHQQEKRSLEHMQGPSALPSGQRMLQCILPASRPKQQQSCLLRRAAASS